MTFIVTNGNRNNIVHTMTQNARKLPLQVRSGTVTGYEYWYDANGNPTHLHDLVQGGNFSRLNQYDGLDRLTASGSASYGGDNWHRFTYDALDNLTSWKLGGVKDYARYVYGASDNRLTRIDNTAGTQQVGLTYDVQGNLSGKNGKVARFDYGNRLRSMDGQGAGLEAYRYDGLGRRVLAWRSADSTITLSQYSQAGQLLYQENTKTALISEHVYLAGSLIATQERPFATWAPTVKYQHTDALGSPVAVTNEAGQVIERTQWEPYGAAIGKPSYNGVGYTGHVMDGATGLTYMQQRYYDPSIGRFLSVDPVTASSANGGNFNRYWYGNNNPYKFSDPDGRLAGIQTDMQGDYYKDRLGNRRNCNFCLDSKSGSTQRATSDLTDKSVTRLSNQTKSALKRAMKMASEKLDNYCATSASDCVGSSSADLEKANIVWASEVFYASESKNSREFTGEIIDRTINPPRIILYRGGIALGFGPGRDGLANVLVHALRHTSPGGTELSEKSRGKPYMQKPSEIDAFDFQRRVMGDDYEGP